jgi:hypothetical protein
VTLSGRCVDFVLYRSARNVRPLVAVVDSEAAGTDVSCSMAQRAGATVIEVDSSHVIMVSQAPAMTDVILETVAAGGAVSGD